MYYILQGFTWEGHCFSVGEMLDFIYVDWDFDMQGFGKSHVGRGFDINPSSM